MTDAATLQAWIAALERARYSGVLSVRHGETSTTFKTDAEMAAALAAAKSDLAAASGTGRRVKYFFQSGKGL